jgi:hypothetical protein
VYCSSLECVVSAWTCLQMQALYCTCVEWWFCVDARHLKSSACIHSHACKRCAECLAAVFSSFVWNKTRRSDAGAMLQLL